MKMFKKNQIIIYVIALMLVTAGYLNYTSSNKLDTSYQTSATEEEMLEMSNIGDAQLVSSNDVVYNNTNKNTTNDKTNSTVNNKTNNVTNNTVTENFVAENNTVTTNSKSSNSDDYFTTSKLERDTMYSQMIATYEKVLNNANSLETQRQSASEEITKINNIKNRIMICENLFKTKGFDNSVIFVNGDSISVIIGTKELSKEQIAQIQNIVSREMNAQIENIHISNK